MIALLNYKMINKYLVIVIDFFNYGFTKIILIMTNYSNSSKII